MRPRAMLCRRAGPSCWRSCNQYRGGPPAGGWVGAIVRHEAGHAAARTNRDAPLRPDGPAAVAADLDGALYRRQLVRVPAGGDRPSAVDVRRCRADAGPRRAPGRRGPAGAPHLPLQRGGAPAPRPQAAALRDHGTGGYGAVAVGDALAGAVTGRRRRPRAGFHSHPPSLYKNRETRLRYSR